MVENASLEIYREDPPSRSKFSSLPCRPAIPTLPNIKLDSYLVFSWRGCCYVSEFLGVVVPMYQAFRSSREVCNPVYGVPAICFDGTTCELLSPNAGRSTFQYFWLFQQKRRLIAQFYLPRYFHLTAFEHPRQCRIAWDLKLGLSKNSPWKNDSECHKSDLEV
jgi:hypothetical protein